MGYPQDYGSYIANTVHYIDEHFHSASKVYPTTPTAVTITCATTAWTLGAAATVVTAGAITLEFDIHHVYVENMSANDTYEVNFYRDSSVFIGQFRVIQNATPPRTIYVPFQTPPLPANSAITARGKSASGGGDTVSLVIHYHTY